jgi:hypothetical protein
MGREGESVAKGIANVNMRGVIVGDQTERERETKKAEGQQGGAWEHPPRISGQIAPRISLQRETVLIAVCVHSLISMRAELFAISRLDIYREKTQHQWRDQLGGGEDGARG